MEINSEILIKEKTSNGVLRLVMNDLKTRNALSENMMSVLMAAINEASINSSIKVVVIASNGNVFCSGHDLKEINMARGNADHGDDYFEKLFKKCSILMQAIINCPKPIIAEINGVATAAGCQLVASCDLARVRPQGNSRPAPAAVPRARVRGRGRAQREGAGGPALDFRRVVLLV